MVSGSTLIALACFVFPFTPLKVIGLIIAGSSDAVLYLLWAEFFGKASPVKVATYFSFAVLLGECIKFVFLGLSQSYIALFTMMLPIFSFLSVKRSFGRISQIAPRNVVVPPSLRSYPWKPILLISLCFFVAAFDASQMRPLNIGNALGAVFVPLLVLVVLSTKLKRFQIGSINQLLFPLFIISFLLLLPTENFSTELISFRYETAYTMLFMLVFIVLSSISYHYYINAIWLNGIERFIRFLTEVFGWGLSVILASLTQPLASSIVHMCLEGLMMAALVVIFFTKRGLSAKWDFRLADEDIDNATLREQHRINELAKTYGLSPREKEIFEHLLQGKSYAQISEELFIAEGTLKAHSNHIFKKLDIHSRKELIAVLNDFDK